MSKLSEMKPYRTADGTDWGVEVQLPGYSNSMVVFHHPDGRSARKDRYAWFDWRGPESQNVTINLDKSKVYSALNDAAIAELFRRSMPIGSGRPAFSPA